MKTTLQTKFWDTKTTVYRKSATPLTFHKVIRAGAPHVALMRAASAAKVQLAFLRRAGCGRVRITAWDVHVELASLACESCGNPTGARGRGICKECVDRRTAITVNARDERFGENV